MKLVSRSRIWTACLANASIVVACSGHQPVVVSSPTPTTYNFAGISTHMHADTVQGIRATITWSIAPITVAHSAQSTWIGIFGEADPTTHRSVLIAQVGWKELSPEPPRVFWEWGIDRDHVSTFYGPIVVPNEHLDVEVERGGDGTFTFYADGNMVGTQRLSWAPSFVAATAETHNPSDVLAGSEAAPELISGFQWKLSGQWQPVTVAPFSSYSQYRVTGDSLGTLRVWDMRANTGS